MSRSFSCHPERSEGSAWFGARSFAALRMTVLVLGVMNLTGERIWAQVLPRSRPVERNLLVLDVQGKAPEVQFAAAALQGLINRESPRVYLRDRLYEGGQDKALAPGIRDWWEQNLREKGHSLEEVRDWHELLNRFA